MDRDWELEITRVMTEVLREEWMSDDEWKFAFQASLNKLGGWDGMEKDIKVGIRNGYSFESQMEIVRSVLRSVKNYRKPYE